MNKNDITVVVYEREFEEDSPENILKFKKWLNGKIALVPADYLKNAEIVLDARPSYEDASLIMRIKYTRPETAEETAQRKLREEQCTLAEELEERELLAALIKKHGNSR